MRTELPGWTGGLIRWADAVAETWLGYDLPPPGRAVAESGWSPDPGGAYCHRCGDSVGPGERTSAGCAICRDTRPAWDRVVRLGAYEPPLREWVLAIKFDRWSEMGEHLGRALGRSLLERVQLDRRRAIVVPMPMPFLRRMHRGIDHSLVLAAALAEELQLPVARLLRAADGPPQATLTAAERRRHGGRRMTLRPSWRERNGPDVQLILVDDVRTTGSSLRAAGRLLQAIRPREVIAAVVAVADDPTRRDRGDRPPEVAPGGASLSPSAPTRPPRIARAFRPSRLRPPRDAW